MSRGGSFIGDALGLRRGECVIGIGSAPLTARA